MILGKNTNDIYYLSCVGKSVILYETKQADVN